MLKSLIDGSLVLVPLLCLVAFAAIVSTLFSECLGTFASCLSYELKEVEEVHIIKHVVFGSLDFE